MKTNIIIGFALLIAGLFSACEKEYFKPVDSGPATGTMSFSKDVVPILNTKCSLSGCHSGSVPPNLSDSKAYGSLVDGALVDTLTPETSILYLKITTNMPPTGKLPTGDISRILLWIKQGAQEN